MPAVPNRSAATRAAACSTSRPVVTTRVRIAPRSSRRRERLSKTGIVRAGSASPVARRAKPLPTLLRLMSGTRIRTNSIARRVDMRVRRIARRSSTRVMKPSRLVMRPVGVAIREASRHREPARTTWLSRKEKDSGLAVAVDDTDRRRPWSVHLHRRPQCATHSFAVAQQRMRVPAQ